ncbi:MAG TPA: hypothetical protein PKD79_01670 [Candidatus Doudnabacteria bacterium]|nr:hypothetical protein [Candidatus Doudnabacteria bacterium]
MSLLIWKILAVITVAFAGLGSGVVIGEELLASPNFEPKLVLNQPKSELVVTSVAQDTVVSIATNSACEAGRNVFHRLDLLLWQNCDFDLKLTEISPPKVIVVAPAPPPKITVVKPAAIVFTSPIEFQRAAAMQLVQAFAMPVWSLKNLAKNPAQPQLHRLVEVIVPQLNPDNSQQFIVMLC